MSTELVKIELLDGFQDANIRIDKSRMASHQQIVIHSDKAIFAPKHCEYNDVQLCLFSEGWSLSRSRTEFTYIYKFDDSLTYFNRLLHLTPYIAENVSEPANFAKAVEDIHTHAINLIRKISKDIKND